MIRRPPAILLLVSLLLQSLLGGPQGRAMICLGGGHEHSSDEAPGTCELACEHEESWPVATPDSEHDHDCGCVDVEFALDELLTLPRSDSETSLALSLPVCPGLAAIDDADMPAWRAPPLPPWFDPGSEQRLGVVATTRLLL